MRRLLSIGFIIIMLIQAIPVLHFFSSDGSIFYAYVEEEKPGGLKEIKDGKEYFSILQYPIVFFEIDKLNAHFLVDFHTSPLLEYTTPPPDAIVV